LALTWIRNPWWDGFWLLSGLPLGFLLLVLAHFNSTLPLAFFATALLSMGHAIAPICLAWGHSDFRPLLRARPIKHIACPILMLLLGAGVGIVMHVYYPTFHADFRALAGISVIDDLANPFAPMMLFYLLWNAFHFGKQNYGVMSIYRRKAAVSDPLQRHIDLIFCCFTTWATMSIPIVPALAKMVHGMIGWPAAHPFLDAIEAICVMGTFIVTAAMLVRERRNGWCVPRVLFIVTCSFGFVASFWFDVWAIAIVMINHWLVAIGLSSHVYSVHRHCSSSVVALVLIIVGVAMFALLFISVPPLAVKVTFPALGLRIGIGFVHFLYDRWVYKLSDPNVGATIGRNMFCLSTAYSGSKL
jgi:hypothetical protein